MPPLLAIGGLLALAVVGACGGSTNDRAPDGSAGASGAVGAAGSGGADAGSGGGAAGAAGGDGGGGGAVGGGGGDDAVPAFLLLGAPLAFSPTAHAFGLNVALWRGDPARLELFVRRPLETTWRPAGPAAHPAPDLASWWVTDLAPGTTYEYLLLSPEGPLYGGTVVTQRPPGTPFSAVLLTDPHIPPRALEPGDMTIANDTEATLSLIADRIVPLHPDFLINLGDILDFHAFGFNDPPPSSAWTRLGYLGYRRLLGDALGYGAHFGVIGNWDGENGCNGEELIERSRSQRLLYEPNPGPDTYPEGGSANQDYYAFTWGDALFIVLNVMTYTSSCHRLDYFPGAADDWTLGETQLAWLRATLANATSKWRFTFIHHTVGGQAGNDVDSAYGRGGGQAARVGEQAIIHQMLIDHGVQIFFYAHDHVFTDMVVDGVHYTLPGSAGAPWKFTTSETGYAAYWPDSGYARLDVGQDAVKVALVGDGNVSLDEITLPEPAAPTSPPPRDE
jgi:hypothetical protein